VRVQGRVSLGETSRAGVRARLRVIAAGAATVAALALAPIAHAGQIVYQHGNDLWAMNDDGSNQHPLIAAHALGEVSLSQPSVDPASGNLSFDAEQLGVCSTNCNAIWSYVGGNPLNLTGPPADCITPVDFECESEDFNPTTTADGRVIFDHTVIIDDLLGFVSTGTTGEVDNLNGTGTLPPWTFPADSGAGTAEQPNGQRAADPLSGGTIAYPGNSVCTSGCIFGLTVDGPSPYIVSYDDGPQQSVAFTQDAKDLVDVEVNTERGIWVYTNKDIHNAANAGTWRGWYVLKDPLPNANDPFPHNYESTFHNVTVTSDGRIVFDNGTNIYALPSTCWGQAGQGFTIAQSQVSGFNPNPDCGTFGQAGANVTQLTTDGSQGSTDVSPTWTSASVPAYTPPAPPASGVSGSSSSGTGGGGATATTAASAGHASGANGVITLTCTGPAAATCTDTVELEVVETFQGSRLIAVAARSHHKTKKTVVVGQVSITLTGGQAKTVTVKLNSKGTSLLRSHHRKLAVQIVVVQGGATISSKTVTLKGH
jgi:hypothetical protein